MLKAQIKSEYLRISEIDLIIKCMNFFEDQFQSSFQSQSKEDTSMNSTKDGEEHDFIIAGEGQDQEDINFEDLDIQEEQMTLFWASLNEDLYNKKGDNP